MVDPISMIKTLSVFPKQRIDDLEFLLQLDATGPNCSQEIQDVPRMTVILNVVPIIVTWVSQCFQRVPEAGNVQHISQHRCFSTFEDSLFFFCQGGIY